MTRHLKKTACIGMALTLLALPLSPAKAEINKPEIYVALGDSVAAGATPYDELDAGYTDIIANKLAQNGLLAAFSKDFAVPGFATSNIIELLDTAEVRQAVEQATMITLSAGANDVLGLVQQDAGGRTVAYDQLTANAVLNQMRIQYGELLDEVQEINPDAAIYAIGYYFPYPHVLETQQQGVRKMLATVNTIIQNEAEARDIEFIDVAEDFDKNGNEYVPNPTDVHPNQEGYTAIASSFFEQVEPSIEVSLNDVPPNPGMSPFLEQLMQSNGGQTQPSNQDEAGQSPAENESDRNEETPAESPEDNSDPQESAPIQENNQDGPEQGIEGTDGAALGPIPAPSVRHHVPLLG
ncbi:GDSL-type esterase/lipase family protein [Jeotgalibacillus sp. S-D1]|uniref:GDSL-type esterase/lipase family protein n=1 Tax=Jeotgalibacillus sp. S-D1 TaxID=2552189 RepID=UPI001405293C|nr:GDSL-type esterase/lipase family protein [Jeotgalibacillus sp. S-D1]